MLARPCSTSPRRSSRQAGGGYATTPRRSVSTGTAALLATARPRREQTAKGDPAKERRPEAQGAVGRAPCLLQDPINSRRWVPPNAGTEAEQARRDSDGAAGSRLWCNQRVGSSC